MRGESGQDVFEYQYDPNGNVIVEKKPGGLTTQYQYDFMNRKDPGGLQRRYVVRLHL
ncbi:RHS repeat domain-containing protein [Cohnella luojiensis]|uniref:RHS repeat domain-containing protein n=1 Tax=Cohnella luojiensis TaxID=652876 RepID=UPI0014305071|nr:RHS repeat domain-containing protein [Cohnella luojiensis]